MIRRALIRLLLKILGISGVEYKIKNEERMRKWLAEQAHRTEFQDYIRKRDMEILQAMGAFPKRESYAMLIGQRVELGRLLSSAKKEFDLLEKQKIHETT